MHGEGVTRALEIQNLHTFFEDFFLAVHDVKRQYRAQLLHGIGIGDARFPLPGNQNLRTPGNGKTSQLPETRRRFSHNLGIQCTIGAKQYFRQKSRFFPRQKVIALLFRFLHHGAFHAALYDDALLGSAGRTVVKGFGTGDQRQGAGYIRTAVDIGRTIARPHADGGLA